MQFLEFWAERAVETLAAIETYRRLNRGRLPRVRDLEVVLGASAGEWRRVCRSAGLVGVMGEITVAGYAFIGEPLVRNIDEARLERQIRRGRRVRVCRSRAEPIRLRLNQCEICHGYHGDRGACALRAR